MGDSGWLVKENSINSTIVNQSYDISNNGTRKLVRLSNGWLVTCVYVNSSTGILFYVSKDNGQTWNQLCSLSSSSSYTSNASITSIGTNVYGIIRNGNTGIDSFTFNAVNQANVNIATSVKSVDFGQTDIPSTNSISIVAAPNGALHAVWASKNTSYPNSYNIRYSKSTDGGNTWNGVTQKTGVNTSTTNCTNPTIVVLNDNNPVIIYQYYDGTNYGIYAMGVSNITSSTYGQTNPYAIVDSNNNIHLVWQGTDSTDTSATNIRYSKYTNGSWSIPMKLTSGNTYGQTAPTITVNKNNDIYVLWTGRQSGSYNQIYKTVYSSINSTWSTPTILIQNASNSLSDPNVVYDRALDFVQPFVMYKDNVIKFSGTYSIDGVYTQNGLQPNTEYIVKVEVKDKSGNTATQTKKVYTKAQVPTVTLGNVSNTSLDVVVSDSNPSNTLYQIISGADFVDQSGSLSNTPVWIKLDNKRITVNSLDMGSYYVFRVKAKNNSGIRTIYSGQADVTTESITVGIPENLTGERASDSINISWDTVEGVTGYDIEADGDLILDLTDTAYLHENLTPNTLHSYRVRAKIGSIAGNFSEIYTVSTLLTAPNPPSIINAVSTSRTVTVSWEDVPSAVAYDIEVDGVVKDNGSSNTYTHTGLSLSTSHSYRVRCKNAAGAGDWSKQISKITQLSAPQVPVPIAEVSNDTIMVNWDEVADAASYDVEVDGVVVNVGEKTYITYTGLNPNTSHNYRIRAKNVVGNSNWSDTLEVTTYILPTPSNLIGDPEETSVTLSWDEVSGATGYDIQINGGATDSTASNSYTHGSLVEDTTYTYMIRAKNGSGTSSWTKLITVTTLPSKPDVPTNIRAVASNNTITIMWDNVTGATGYDVLLDGITISNGNSTVYIHDSLGSGTAHTYQIRSRNTRRVGDWSQTRAINSLLQKPSKPEDVTTSITDDTIILRWSAVSGASSYDVEVDGSVVSNVNRLVYIYRGITANSVHTFRVRAKNIAGNSDWCTLITDNTIAVNCSSNKDFELNLTANNVSDLSKYTFTVKYKPEVLEVIDLSTPTPQNELTVGKIAGTNINIVSFTDGKIVFTIDNTVKPGELWTGITNKIKFRAKATGETIVTYAVQ